MTDKYPTINCLAINKKGKENQNILLTRNNQHGSDYQLAINNLHTRVQGVKGPSGANSIQLAVYNLPPAMMWDGTLPTWQEPPELLPPVLGSEVDPGRADLDDEVVA